MQIHILGSAAGGGFPQWNCNCHNCHGIRTGRLKGLARNQSSIAVSANGTDWVLFNASPDIRAQIQSFPPLQPARAVRDTGIVAIILCDAQIDHTTGLMMLREHTKPWPIYCTEEVHQDLTGGYPLLNVLGHFCGVEHRLLATDQSRFVIPEAAGLEFVGVPLKSEAPPYSPHRHKTRAGDNMGFRVTDTESGKSFFYAPGLGFFEPHLTSHFAEADCLLVDGTVWTDDEMSKHQISKKRASEMGHLAQSGRGGIFEILKSLEKPRKILIHINNTNPVLDEESDERALLDRSGIEVSYDGMHIDL